MSDISSCSGIGLNIGVERVLLLHAFYFNMATHTVQLYVMSMQKAGRIARNTAFVELHRDEFLLTVRCQHAA